MIQSDFSQTIRECQYWHQRMYYVKEKETSHKMLPPGSLIISDSNTLLSELVRHVLLRGSLILFLCTTSFLNLDDLVSINRA